MLRGFGAGLLPIAPGTWGAAVAVLLAWPVAVWQPTGLPYLLGVLILTFFGVGVVGSNRMEAEWGKDPSQTVIDEMVGMWIALLLLPTHWPYWLAAFFLFRLFDIFKPLGIRRLENLPGGWGVMLDDVLAGLYANLLLQAYWMLA